MRRFMLRLRAYALAAALRRLLVEEENAIAAARSKAVAPAIADFESRFSTPQNAHTDMYDVSMARGDVGAWLRPPFED